MRADRSFLSYLHNFFINYLNLFRKENILTIQTFQVCCGYRNSQQVTLSQLCGPTRANVGQRGQCRSTEATMRQWRQLWANGSHCGSTGPTVGQRGRLWANGGQCGPSNMMFSKKRTYLFSIFSCDTYDDAIFMDYQHTRNTSSTSAR